MKYVARVKGVGKSLGFLNWFVQRIIGLDRDCFFQKHFTSRVLHASNLVIENDDQAVRLSLAASAGCYLNAADGLFIGEGTIWGPNVSLVSQHHDLMDFASAPLSAGIRIGRHCWLGAGSVILPGVVLGERTVVGANAVVRDSFPEGHCVLAGVPAKRVKSL